jgi:RNA polymerase sigma-70 factor (sigma-E family)
MSSARASFNAFVREHVNELLRVAVLITWDEGEAEDLVQECLLRVAKRWPRVRQMDVPYAYARKVLVNLALDGRARRSRRLGELARGGNDELDRTAAMLAIPDADAQRALHDLAERSELMEALGVLTPQQRTVLGLRYFVDLSEAQVAELLDCSVGTVKSSASRGLSRLREVLPELSSRTGAIEP